MTQNRSYPPLGDPPPATATPPSSGYRLLKNAGWLLGGKTFAALLSLVYLAMLTRSLGPENFGVFALIFSFAQLIAGVVSFQTWQIIIRYGTRDILDQRSDRFGQVVMLCLSFDLASFVVGGVFASAGAFYLGVYYGWSHGFSVFVMIFCWMILLSARGTPSGILAVHDRFRDAALGDSLVPLLRFLGVAAAILIAPTLVNFLLVWALSELLATLVMWIVVWRTTSLRLGTPTIAGIVSTYRLYPGIGRFAAFTNLGASVRLASQQFIVVIVGFFVGPAAAGFFRLGHQLGQVLARIADAIAQVLFAEFNRIAHADGHAATTSLINQGFKVTALSAGTLLLLLVFLGKVFLLAVFGSAFVPAYPLVVILGAAAALQVGSAALEPALLARGQSGQALIAGSMGLATLLVFLPALLPAYQEQGAAYGVLIAAAATTLWLIKSYRAGA
jgi:O-antigen/teichoic acid export membrane protein